MSNQLHEEEIDLQSPRWDQQGLLVLSEIRRLSNDLHAMRGDLQRLKESNDGYHATIQTVRDLKAEQGVIRDSYVGLSTKSALLEQAVISLNNLSASVQGKVYQLELRVYSILTIGTIIAPIFIKMVEKKLGI